MNKNYVQEKIKRVSESFNREYTGPRLKFRAAETVERAKVYTVWYCQTAREMRDDYYEYVYDNSFARRRRRNR